MILDELINRYKNLNIKQTATDYALLCNKANYEIEKINTANNGLFLYTEDLLTYAKTHDIKTLKNIVLENVNQLKNTLGIITNDYEEKAEFVNLLCSTVIQTNNKYTKILNDMQNEKLTISDDEKKEQKTETEQEIKDEKNKKVENVILEEGEKSQPEFEHLAGNVKNEQKINNTHLNYVKDNLDSLIFALGTKAEEELGQGGSEFVDDIISEIRNCNAKIDYMQIINNNLQNQYNCTLNNLQGFISTFVNSYYHQKLTKKENTNQQNKENSQLNINFENSKTQTNNFSLER